MQLILLWTYINKIPTNLKNYAGKYGNHAHDKTQPNYKNLGKIYCVKHNQLITPKLHWFMLVHLTIEKLRLYLNIYEGSFF